MNNCLAKRNIPFVEHVKRVVPVCVCTILLLTLIPSTAHAAGLFPSVDDLISSVHGMICGWLLDIASVFFNAYFGIIESSIDFSYMTKSFSVLFGMDKTFNVYSDVVKVVHQSVVIPVAQSILALLMLVQLVKISQKIDATSTLPAVKEIVFLVVFFAIFSWLINNSLDILSAIYDIFNDIAIDIKGDGNTKLDGIASIDFSQEDKSNVTMGGCAMLVILAMLSAIIGIVSFVLVLVIAFARSLQIYVMATFSPIPLALLGFEETRQSSINFLKNFCAICLAGAILVFILIAYPHILASVCMSSFAGGDESLSTMIYKLSAGASITTAGVLFKWLAITLVYILGIVKSGSWAKEIMGV